MNINIGSGPNHVEGWLEFDSSLNIPLSRIPYLKSIIVGFGLLNSDHMRAWDPRIKRKNALKLDLKISSVDQIYLSHVLEHMYFSDSQKLLMNCHDFLKDMGVLRICSPDYDAFISKYLNEIHVDSLEAAFNFEKSLLSYPLNKPSLFEFVRNYFGAHIHYWHPTLPIMLNQLKVAGFTRIEILSFRQGQLSDLELIENRADMSFYLEAYK